MLKDRPSLTKHIGLKISEGNGQMGDKGAVAIALTHQSQLDLLNSQADQAEWLIRRSLFTTLI